MSRSPCVLGTVLLAVSLAACSTDGRTLAPALPDQTESVAIAPTVTTVAAAPEESFSIRGPWSDGAEIDLRYTCYGDGVSPSIQIANAAPRAESLAVLLYDVENPGEALWLVANLAGDTVAIGEGATPPNVIVATNSDGNVGYQPPCPPEGERRQYLLTLFALDAVLVPTDVTGADGVVDAETLLTAIEMRTFDLAESAFYVQAP